MSAVVDGVIVATHIGKVGSHKNSAEDLSGLQGAARMLIRVSADIVNFPKHVVPILTSTVMQCQRAGLQRSAFSHCQALMQPELVDSINPAYRHKAASLLRQDSNR